MSDRDDEYAEARGFMNRMVTGGAARVIVAVLVVLLIVLLVRLVTG